MPRIPWEQNGRIPKGIGSVLAALRFSDPDVEALGRVDERDWPGLLDFCDRMQMTLVVGMLHSKILPSWVQERIYQNMCGNTKRSARYRQSLFEICDRFDLAGVDYLLLKGLSHLEDYTPDPSVRVQYDIDLYAPGQSLAAARDALLGLGYEPLSEFEEFPTDHLPIMVRKTGWQWRGDFFDPEIPVPVDLHFRFWDETTDRLAAPGVDQFWLRRARQTIGSQPVPVLARLDAAGYAALHLLRHLMRGSIRIYHVYELAFFLNAHRGDNQLWAEWRGLHAPELRTLETVAFCLAADWFSCPLPGAVQEERERLPAGVRRWLECHSAAPVEAVVRPNKEELWLHLSLVSHAGDRMRVLRRRLLPMRLPGPVEAIYVPDTAMTARLRWIARSKYVAHLVSRFKHHAALLLPTLWSGVMWLLETRGPEPPFWRFLLTASVYHLGVFVFVLLYNLYLLDIGFRENFLGLIAGVNTLGSLAGTLPAAWIARRLGLRVTLLSCFAGSAVVSAARCVFVESAPLLATAFLGGVASSCWFVSVSPTVSALTSEQKRPLGFSLFFAAGIAVGIAGGLLGGSLPGWIQGMTPSAAPWQTKKASLLAACVLIAFAIWPGRRLRLPAADPETRTYPWNPFLARFLPALAVWSFAVGAFNPFFTAYFARHLHVAESGIGVVFSTSQLVQVAALLLAPVVLGRFGLIGGIAGIELAAALALGALASGPPILAAAAAYTAFMAFQSMTEPGAYTLLMKHVRPPERSGASALNFLVIFTSQSAAAALAGVVITRWGYPAVLIGAGALAACASVLFFVLLRRFRNDI